MRKLKLLQKLMLLLFAVTISNFTFGQLTGTKTIPGDYATLAAAITDLNTVGIGAGGVTFNIAAGYTETFATPTAGLITATGTSGNPIIFQKFGAGANPIITAAGGVSTSVDGIIVLRGSDYVTFDGIDLMESVGNTTATTQMEWGYAFVKVDGTNGAQYNNIKNCTVVLNKANTNSAGIYFGNHTDANTTTLSVTDLAGTNSYNKINGNNVSNAFTDIYINGYNDVSPYTYYDQGNEIGFTTGNTISNFGGASTNYGIYIRNNNNFKISNNIITNAGVTSTTRGIYLAGCTNASGDVNNNNIQMSSSAATNQLTAIESAITGTGTINIFANNVHDFTYPTATTGTVYLIYQNAGVANLNIYNNIVTNNSATGTGAFGAIYAASTVTTASIYGNTISANSKTAASGTMYCLRAGTGTISIHDNIISNNSFTTTTGSGVATIYGYYNYGSPLIEDVFNNQINGLTINGVSTGSHVIYGINTNTTASAVKNIYANAINNINISTGNGAVYGIYQALGTPTNVFKNTVYNLSAAGTGGLTNGIYISSGATNNVYNNLVSDLKAPDATGANAINGINIAGGTTANVYYNTVYLNATSTSATTFGTSGIYKSSTTTGDFRNNIIVNNSAYGPTGGLTVAYRWSGAYNATYYAATSNNNCFYAGTPSATNLIFYDGTNADQTIAAYKTRVTPKDAAAFSENPPFMNVATTPYNLHLQTTVATQCESGGTPITTPIVVAVDFDNDSRNASTPDVGADEGNFTGLDLSAPTISYTALSNTSSLVNRTLVATITDASGIGSGANQPVLYWKINAAASYTGPVAPTSIAGSQYTYDFGAGVVAGDVVSYFIVAQDNATTPNVGSYPSGATCTINPPLASAGPATPSTYTILGYISGVKTVGTGGDYTTLTAAFNALIYNELSGPLTFSLLNTDYSTGETFPLVINVNTGSSATNTITIKPAAGVTSVITGNAASSVIAINGADYVTIDGSNTVGGTTKDLTIVNTYTGSTFNFAVGLYHNGTKGATNNTIKNCIIEGTPTVTNSYGLFLNAAGGGFNNTSIINNTIRAAKTAIQFVGVLGNISYNGVISGNIIGDATKPLLKGGILAGYVDNLTITNNEILGQAAGNTNYSQYGINILTGSTNIIIRKNQIHDFYYTGTSGYGCWGIMYNSGSATTPSEISNNMIYNIKADGDQVSGGSSNFTYIPSGISINTGGNLLIANNTINLTGNTLGTSYTGNSACMVINTTATLLDIRNNIFKNSMTTAAGTGTNKTFGIATYAANTAFTNINYNDYFIDGINANVGYLTTDQLDLAAWRTATAQDLNSFVALPFFTSNSDLHLIANSNCIIDGKGTPIASITTDIDGDARNTTTPDPGADEFTLVPLVAPTAANQAACFGGTIPDLTATVVGTALWYSDAALTNLVFTGTPFATGETAVGTYTYYVIDSLGDCLSPSTMVTLTIGDVPAQPTAIAGEVEPLENSSQVYSVTNVPGVIYNWTFPAGWVQTAGGTTNSVTVTVSVTAGNVVCTPSNSCGDGTPSTLFVTPNGLGMKNYTNNHVSIYPNPTSDKVTLTFKGLNNEIKLKVLNVQGGLMFTSNFEASTNNFTQSLDLSNYPNGMYYIQIENNGKTYVNKIVKQ